VVDHGMIPTPLSYYSTHRMAIDGAVMITGSHNPPEYNGFKISLGTEAIYGTEIQNVREIIEKGVFESGKGQKESYDIKPEYIDDLAARLKLTRPVKIAVDCGNGVSGLVAGKLLSRLGCQVTMLYSEVDGKFPHHHPDPTVEKNLTDLKKAVIENKLELGIAYDGDGDRIGIVDEKGQVLWGDQILAILARDVLRVVPGSTIIGEVKCSQLLFDDIKHHGGVGVMWKVGHSLIKSEMHESGAQLAGEMSGHIFFSHRYYGFDDAVYVSGRFLEITAAADRPVSRFLEDWPKLYNTPEIRVDCPDEIKFQVVDRVRDYFRCKYDLVDVDGMRVMMPGGWGLLRASNTQPVLVLRFEADSPERLTGIRTEVEEKLQQIKDTF
jgi:phosphomannomutase/phosphoglucomutase